MGGTGASFAAVLDEMAATGYAATELGDWGFLPTEPDALRAELSRRALGLIGAFVPVPLTDAKTHEAGVEAALRVARLLAAAEGRSPLVVLSDATARDAERTQHAGRIGPEHGLDARGWDTLARGANQIGRRVADDTGLRTVFHHHCATFIETEQEIDELMRRTDPALVGLCLDTARGFRRRRPVTTESRWRDRIWPAHMKDCDAAIRRGCAEAWDYQQSVRAECSASG